MPANREILRDLALRLDKSSLTFSEECLRYRFEESKDLLALMASDGRFLYDELLALIRSSGPGVEDLDAYALSNLMRLVAGLLTSGELMAADFEEAADLSAAARRLKGETEFSYIAPRIEGQVNLASGRYDRVLEMLAGDELNDDTAWMLSTELAHPANGWSGASSDTWLERFNRRFEKFGLLPIRIAPGEGDPFDRVTVDIPDGSTVDGPLVTVVMSTYCPNQSFRTAVESLLRQTWHNLELLILDDCSPPEYDALLTEIAALDPRIQLIRMPENGGTYRIRNEAIRRSRGEFLTFHDSDDWAHPQRLERQIEPLLERPELVATHCRCVRAFPDLSTLNVGMNSFRRCAPSTFIRKDVVIRVLGGFDETRKEADNEFYERIKTVFGEDANVDLPDVLVMYQLTADSLSRDEYRFGWQHPARAMYIQSRRHWHRAIAAGASPRLEVGALRRFHAPSRVLVGRDTPPASCDVLWISDWRDGLARYDGQVNLVRATIDAGLATLAAQATAMRHADRDRVQLRDELLELQDAGATRIVLWPDVTEARLAVVTDPELLNLTRPPDTVGIRPRRLVVAAPHPPAAPVDGWLTYDPSVVEANALRMFGVAVEWLPASAAIGDALRARGAERVLEPAHLLVAPDVVPREHVGRALSLIVGVSAIETRRRDRPSMTELREWLPTSDGFDVRLLDERLEELQLEHRRWFPLAWVAFGGETPLEGFQSRLDVFGAVPTNTWGPYVPWSAVTAMAHGAAVMAAPEYESLLGDSAVYAAPGEAEEVLAPLKDPERLAQQRQRGYDFCRDRASAEALVALIGKLGGMPRREDA